MNPSPTNGLSTFNNNSKNNNNSTKKTHEVVDYVIDKSTDYSLEKSKEVAEKIKPIAKEIGHVAVDSSEDSVKKKLFSWWG